MPVYDYRCAQCGHVTTAIRCIAQRNEPLPCEVCGAPMKLEVSPVRGKVDKPAVPRRIKR